MNEHERCLLAIVVDADTTGSPDVPQSVVEAIRWTLQRIKELESKIAAMEAREEAERKKCHACGGAGVIDQGYIHPDMQRWIDCSVCGGSGER